MAFHIKLYTCDSEANKVQKTIRQQYDLTGVLVDQSSIIDPVIRIQIAMANINKLNYMYIQEFGRYYFIKDIISFRENMVDLHAHVDVLMSFRNEILTNMGIVKKSETEWNLYLNDGSIHTYQYTKTTTLKFSTGFPTGIDLVMAIAGKSNVGT